MYRPAYHLGFSTISPPGYASLSETGVLPQRPSSTSAAAFCRAGALKVSRELCNNYELFNNL
jgi:hypothetical protein